MQRLSLNTLIKESLVLTKRSSVESLVSDADQLSVQESFNVVRNDAPSSQVGAAWFTIADRWKSGVDRVEIVKEMKKLLLEKCPISDEMADRCALSFPERVCRLVEYVRSADEPDWTTFDAANVKDVQPFRDLSDPNTFAAALSEGEAWVRTLACLRCTREQALALRHLDSLREIAETDPLVVIRQLAQKAIATCET